MEYDKRLIAGKLRRWEKYLNNYRLPEWEAIPDFGLYMEQVLALLKEYLDYLPPELKEEQFLTAATINNYVRNKFMPMPCKKTLLPRAHCVPDHDLHAEAEPEHCNAAKGDPHGHQRG